MIKRFLYILIFSVISISSFAQKEDMGSFIEEEEKSQTEVLKSKLAEHQSLTDDFLKNWYANPSLHFYRFNTSLTNISLNGTIDKHSMSRKWEEGREGKELKFKAESFVKMNENSSVWGEAYYQVGKKNQVLWNESSDYDKIYPYVSADTLGGYMNGETYYFKGGYSHQIKRWTLGGEFYYRALLESRKSDPRPLNSVADIAAQVGASYAINSQYAIALHVNGQKYKQNDRLDYYNVLGKSMTYHNTGLGTTYKRFNGTNNNVSLQGNQWIAGFDLLPLSKGGGWAASFEYEYDFLKKILRDVQNIILNDRKGHAFQGQVGWMSPKQENHFGFKAEGAYHMKTGRDFIYGDAGSKNYPLLAKQKNFRSHESDTYLKGFWEMTPANEGWYGSADVYVGYHSSFEEALSTHNSMDLNDVDMGFRFISDWIGKNQIFRLSAGADYQAHLTDHLQLKQVDMLYVRDILQNNYHLLSADRLHYACQVRYSHIFSRMIGFVEGEWQQTFFLKNTNGYLMNLKLGIQF